MYLALNLELGMKAVLPHVMMYMFIKDTCNKM